MCVFSTMKVIGKWKIITQNTYPIPFCLLTKLKWKSAKLENIAQRIIRILRLKKTAMPQPQDKFDSYANVVLVLLIEFFSTRVLTQSFSCVALQHFKFHILCEQPTANCQPYYTRIDFLSHCVCFYTVLNSFQQQPITSQQANTRSYRDVKWWNCQRNRMWMQIIRKLVYLSIWYVLRAMCIVFESYRIWCSLIYIVYTNFMSMCRVSHTYTYASKYNIESNKKLLSSFQDLD